MASTPAAKPATATAAKPATAIAANPATATAANPATATAADPATATAANPATATAVTNQSPNCPCPDIANIAKVDIDKDGVFMYVALTVRDPLVRSSVAPVVIIRGYKKNCDFTDLIAEVQERLLPLVCEPFVGGFINHDSVNKRIHIFGHAVGVDKGKPDREYIAKLIRKEYPHFKVTTGAENIPPPPTHQTATAPAPSAP